MPVRDEVAQDYTIRRIAGPDLDGKGAMVLHVANKARIHTIAPDDAEGLEIEAEP